MSIIKNIKSNLSSVKNIVFPEGWNPVIVEATLQLKKEGKVNPILIVKKDSDVLDNGLTYLSVESYEGKAKLAELLFEIRKGKVASLEDAAALVEQPNYFATMLIKNGDADGYVGGIEYTTGDTLRPALQIIKTAPGSNIVSSVFIMEKGKEQYLFADCAIIPEPTQQNIEDITKQVIDFGADTMGFDQVRAALLSYSTAGSAGGNDPQKMEDAYANLAKEDFGNHKVFGSMQFDAAFVQGVLDKKAPDLGWKETANAFVFPSLSAGNIAYKVAQRMGGYDAIGPVIMGLAAPVNDLSRGASAQDVVSVSYITASQVK